MRISDNGNRKAKPGKRQPDGGKAKKDRSGLIVPIAAGIAFLLLLFAFLALLLGGNRADNGDNGADNAGNAAQEQQNDNDSPGAVVINERNANNGNASDEQQTGTTATIDAVEGKYSDDSATVTIRGKMQSHGEGGTFTPSFNCENNEGRLFKRLDGEPVQLDANGTADYSISATFSYDELDTFRSMLEAGSFKDAVKLTTGTNDISTMVAEMRHSVREEWDAARAQAGNSNTEQPAQNQAASAPAEYVEDPQDERVSYDFAIEAVNSRPTDQTWAKWDEGAAPDYILKIGDAVIGNLPERGRIVYGTVDNQGRPTTAVGYITKEKIDGPKAGGFADDVKPSGWPSDNPEVDVEGPDNSKYHGKIWQKSHLLGSYIGGSSTAHNAITGTKMQDTGADGHLAGMAKLEDRVHKWLEGHADGSVYYRVTPMFSGNEGIPRSVIVDIHSSDNEINERDIVYNTAKGFDIDYANGTVVPGSGKATAPAVQQPAETTVEQPQGGQAQGDAAPQGDGSQVVYVMPSDTHHYHLYQDCPLLKRGEYGSMSRDDAMRSGRSTCETCGRRK